jgi:hypothetical protein
MHVARVWAALLAAGLAGAALAAAPDAKPGLWERTVTRQMEGAPVSPVADVTKLPPEQRARIEQMLATRGLTAPSVSVVRYCVAPASAPSWAAIAREERDDAGCARTVEADSSAGYRASLACAGGATATLDFAVVAPDRFRGTITSSSPGDTGPRTVRVDVDSRWLGPDCGTVAPGQPARVKG